MSWFSDLFGGGGNSQDSGPEPLRTEPPWYNQLRQTIGNRLQGLLDTGPEQYGGQLVAPLSQYQNQSLEQLGQYGNQGTPSLIGEGANEISQTLASQYDPETSAYFQAFRDQRLYDLGESKRRFNEDSASGTGFFHGARVEGGRKLDEAATRDISSQNAILADRERQRRLDVLPMGLQYANAQTAFPLQRIAALQQYGALPQQQGQAEDTAAYSEWLRQLQQGRADLGQANQFAGPAPFWNYNGGGGQGGSGQVGGVQLLGGGQGGGGQGGGGQGGMDWAQIAQIIASIASTAATASCHVAEVLYGVDDPRTHLARRHVAVHDTAFLRAYRMRSKAWAAWLRAHPDADKFFRPIWNAMAMEQMALSV